MVRSAHFTPLEKSPAIIKLIEDGIFEAQKQRFNDLLGEIAEFNGTGTEQASEQNTSVVIPTPEREPTVTPPEGDTADGESFNFFGSPPDQTDPQDSTVVPAPEQQTTTEDHTSDPIAIP